MNEDIKRPVLLALTDDNIDHMIHLLSAYLDDDTRNVIKQLKAEQKRLFYPEQISSVRSRP